MGKVVSYLDPNLNSHAVDMLVVEGTKVIGNIFEKERAFEILKRIMKIVKKG